MAWRFKLWVKFVFWALAVAVVLFKLIPTNYSSYFEDFKTVGGCEKNLSSAFNLSCPPEKMCPECNKSCGKTENVVDARELVIYIANATCSADYEVWRFANEFAVLLEEGAPERIYSLLSEKRKAVVSKSEFSKHYAGVVYGSARIYTDDSVISSLKRNIFSSVFVENLSVSNNTAGASLINLRKDGTYERLGIYHFVKERGSWRVDDFDMLVYASCSVEEDCKAKSAVLAPACESTCRAESRFYDLRNDTPFSCAGEVCECRCINFRDGIGHIILPDPEFIG